MDDIFEKKIKEFLPYIIIIAALYLVMPAIMVLTNSSAVFNQIIYIGVFPLTAFACNFHYVYKKQTDLFLTFVAPVIYIPSMLLYGNLRDSVLNSIIFLVSYFICGYLGQTVADMVGTKSDDKDSDKKDGKGNAKSDKHYTRKRVPKRVRPSAHEHMVSDRLPEDIEMPQSFEELSVDDTEPSISFESTSDDIDAILNEIHNRNDF